MVFLLKPKCLSSFTVHIFKNISTKFEYLAKIVLDIFLTINKVEFSKLDKLLSLLLG